MTSPTYDLVLFGVTGFSGRLVAEQLLLAARNEPVRLGLAGRNLAKLEEVRALLAASYPEAKDLPLLQADSGDPGSLAKLAVSTRVVVTTVGPYARYGSGLVEACAKAGTHYCDLTGETPWMREMIDRHQSTAEHSGARIVFTCGFDSIPSDLGTYFIQGQCQQRWGHPAQKVTALMGESSGGVSGGTAESMKELMAQIRENPEIRKILGHPYSLNPDRSFRGPDGSDPIGPGKAPHLDLWTAPFFMGPVNTRVVRRGHALMGMPWGKDFQYEERMTLPKGVGGAVMALGVSMGMAAVVGVMVSPLRGLVESRLPAAGEGPSAEARAKGHWRMRFVAESGEKFLIGEAGDKHADPGYGSTSKMLSQSGLCLAKDPLKVGGGLWTPASAMGDFLIPRLQKVGLHFQVNEG